MKPDRWLCFHSVPVGGGDQYFADGITEAVTTELGRVGGLRVIASNSTFAYRDKTAFRDIARELGVGLVVRGSVQRAGGKVRIDVSLVDARDDTALWSERYSRELTDVLTVQDEISRQIANTLSRTLRRRATGEAAVARHHKSGRVRRLSARCMAPEGTLIRHCEWSDAWNSSGAGNRGARTGSGP